LRAATAVVPPCRRRHELLRVSPKSLSDTALRMVSQPVPNG